jgi:exopolysaccharide biosynthesis WecB/TagA/CpsF family protein
MAVIAECCFYSWIGGRYTVARRADKLLQETVTDEHVRASIRSRSPAPGPIAFRQRQVGNEGRALRVRRVRTLPADPKHPATELLDRNEREGSPFRIRDGPSVARVGTEQGELRARTRRPPALLFGTPIADLDMTETLDLIGELVAEGRTHRRTHQIATVNVDFLVNALRDTEIATILQDVDVCIADGMPVVWGARALGMPIRDRVAGSDLVPLLIEASHERGWHVHVFGSTPAVAESARALLRDRFPNARFSIDHGPMIGDVEQVDDEVLDSITAVDADILCIALGNPKQERFIRTHAVRLGAPVMIGIGGSIDMLVGKRRRAPVWVQRAGLEWVVRALQEPRRLGLRYMRDIRVFGPTFTRHYRASRRRRGGAGLQLEFSEGAVHARLEGMGIPTAGTWETASQLIRAGATLTIDAGPTTEVRDDAIAALVGLVRLARRAGSDVIWQTSPTQLRHRIAEIGITPGMLGLPAEWAPDHNT